MKLWFCSQLFLLYLFGNDLETILKARKEKSDKSDFIKINNSSYMKEAVKTIKR